MTFVDFNKPQIEALKNKINNLVSKLSEPITRITLEDPFFDLDKQHFAWFGGDVLTIEYQGWKFTIAALGDVKAWLTDNLDGHQVIYVKDKHNGGTLGSKIGAYISSDTEMTQLFNQTHPRYSLTREDNNWRECYLVDPEGNHHDLMWCLDADYLLDAVAEVIPEIDNTITQIIDENDEEEDM